eukprot:COSAG01_NODE_13094_length_1636_cov_4.320104_2_plen_45_part_00
MVVGVNCHMEGLQLKCARGNSEHPRDTIPARELKELLMVRAIGR